MKKNYRSGLIQKNNLIFVLFAIIYFVIGSSLGLVHLFYDDFEMLMIARGDFPYLSDSFIYYSSSYLGAIYQIFYKLNSNWEWYNIVYLFVISISLSLLTVQLINKLKGDIKLLLVFAVFIFHFCLLNFLTNVQFTFAAGVLTICSLVSLRMNLESIKMTLFNVLAVIIALFGSLYRFEMFILVFTIVIASFSLLDLILKTKTNKSFYIIAIIIALLSGSIRFIEVQNQTDNQKEFVSFHKARGAFGDYDLPGRISNREEVEKKLGWGKIEKDLITTWSYPDFDKLKIENLNYYVRNADKSRSWSLAYIKEYARYALNDVIFKDQRHVILLLFLLLIALYISNTKKLIVVALSFFITLFLLLFLTVYFKIPGSQVQLPMYFFIALFAILLIDSNSKKYEVNNLVFLSLILVSFVFIVQNFRKGQNEKREEYNKVHELDLQIKKIADTIYSLPTNYPGYAHFVGLRNNKKEQLKVFYNGLFFNHPSNHNFTTLWQKKSLLAKNSLKFYFKSQNQNQMVVFSNAFRGYVLINYNLNYTEEVHNLSDNSGYILELLKVENKNLIQN
jgi:hypothetical protein